MREDKIGVLGADSSISSNHPPIKSPCLSSWSESFKHEANLVPTLLLIKQQRDFPAYASEKEKNGSAGLAGHHQNQKLLRSTAQRIRAVCRGLLHRNQQSMQLLSLHSPDLTEQGGLDPPRRIVRGSAEHRNRLTQTQFRLLQLLVALITPLTELTPKRRLPGCHKE